jgi:hypothetical protein
MPLPVKIGPHASKFHKLPIFPVFSQEKRPFHMVNQQHRYGKLMNHSQVLICIKWCGSIMPFACQDLASRIKISQMIYFSHVFSGKKTLAHGESKT